MRNKGIGRRALLRLAALAAGCGALGWGSEAAWAQPPRPARKPAPPWRRLPVVVIDPGHGGIDPGAISPDGVYEKDIVLAAARDFAHQLWATRRFRVVMTRRDDVFVPLRERVARARAAHADLMLSIHADELPNTALRGLSVYTLSAKASDREAAALAHSENGADVVDGINLAHEPPLIGQILFDLARRRTNNLSLSLARSIVGECGRYVPLLEHPQRAAGFVVLTAPDIPSALVELGNLSNSLDDRLLQEPAYRRKLAHALVLGIDAYFAGEPRLAAGLRRAAGPA
jgi:N-acetylmuramoyl-L-alanine amidase